MVKAGNDNSKGSKATMYESSKSADRSIDKDPLRHTELKPTEFQQTTKPYEYKPYKPTTIGMYGDKPYVKQPYQEPNIENPDKKPKVVKSLKTFESYRFPKGPDIKIDNTGPEYKVRDFQLTSYLPGSPYKPQHKPPTENQYLYKEFTIYKGDVTYKLTEDNNAAMRHWKRRFVDDTVACKHYTDNPGGHYIGKDKPNLKPKKSPATRSEKKLEETPKVERAQVAAVNVKSMLTQTTPLDVKSSSTQYDAANVKAFGTQYERIKMESLSVQTDTQPLPPIVPLAMTQDFFAPKVLTKSTGIQCTMVPKSMIGTQSDVPKVYTEAPRKPSSPELYVVPVVTAAGKPETHTVSPTFTTMNKTKTTPGKEIFNKQKEIIHPSQSKIQSVKVIKPQESESAPNSQKAPVSNDTLKNDSGFFPAYDKITKSTLPPEVRACIEAYDDAHGPNLDVLPSIKRSMQLV